MKKITLLVALFAAVPLVGTACSKDKGSNGDGDGDGDGTGGLAGDGDGDGDGDGTGGLSGDGDGDGDTGGMQGDGDGDATGGMGGFGGDGMGGMGGGAPVDLETLCTTVCTVKVAEDCVAESNQTACEVACEMGFTANCESEWVARLTCEATLDETGWECNPNTGGFFPWYTQVGIDACGDTLDAYTACDAN